MKAITIPSVDEYQLELNIYEINNPLAVVFVNHGMEEYQDYYQPFCEFLARNNYISISANMRGHGRNVKALGYFDEYDGANLLVHDQLAIIKYIKEHYPHLPLYAFSHSMGTIITRNVLLENSHLFDKVILSGYTNIPFGISLVIRLSSVMQTLKSPFYHSKLLDDLVIGAFNKPLKNPRTDWDWLAYNQEYVQAYIDDPLCGQPFTVSGHHDLFVLTKNMGTTKLTKNINNHLPILLLSGEDDTCTGNAKQRATTLNIFNKLGFSNVTMKTYQNARHVILQESINQEVYQDVLKFFESPIK